VSARAGTRILEVEGLFVWQAALALGVASFLLLFGYTIARSVCGPHLDGIDVAALAFPGIVAFSLLLMSIHIATGGTVFSNVWIVRSATLVSFVAAVGIAIRRWRRVRSVDRSSILALVILIALAVVLWSSDAVTSLPIAHGGDVGWHAGWTNQLLNGESTPSASVAGDVPNYYPWLFHGVAAITCAFVPGRNFYVAQAPIQLMQVVALVLVLFALGRTLGKGWMSGSATAFLGTCAAAYGPVIYGVVGAIGGDEAQRSLRFESLDRSFNVAFWNAPPALPRDVAFTLLLSFFLLLTKLFGPDLETRPRRSTRVSLAAGAGFVLGLVALISPRESLFLGILTLLVACFLQKRVPKHLALGLVAGPAVLMLTLWLAPLALSYSRLGGFVNTTASRPVEPPLVSVFLSFNIVPLLALGAVPILARGNRMQGWWVTVMSLLVATLVLLVAVPTIPRLLGESFETLGRQQRIWALLDLALIMPAALAATNLLLWTRKHFGHLGPAAIAVTALVVTVPFTMELNPRAKRFPPSPKLAHAILGDSPSTLKALHAIGPGRCVMAIPPRLSQEAFAYTGYRLVASGSSGRRHKGNAARIRWRDIYTYIASDRARSADNHRMINGLGTQRSLDALLSTYGVDAIVPAGDGAKQRLKRKLGVRSEDGIILVTDCGEK
jgi:hypothetical protein